MSQTMESFPDFIVDVPRLHSAIAPKSLPGARRKSSSLGSDIRGDTGAPAVSTLEPRPVATSPQLSPRSSSSAVPRVLRRRKARSLYRRWKTLSFTHTWVNPLVVILIILSLYAINPTSLNPLHCAIFLSYPLPANSPFIPKHDYVGLQLPIYYGKGSKDLAFVGFYIVVLSFAREIIMQRLIRPMARHFGIRSRAKQSRFMEQVYTAMYFGISGPFGVYVMSRTPVWYFNTRGMFETYPHRSHEALFKAYYLLQASYWAQQAIVLCLQLEKPRKDFRELVAHHIVTLTLIGLSYRFHFTYIGLAVYITHDISDFFLATSKSLNYLESPIIVPYFTLFTCVWIYLRHYINLGILYAVLTTFRTVGPFELNWETQQYKSWISQYIAFVLLAFLQAINLFWLCLILKIAVNVVLKDVAQDVRSEAEESEGEEGTASKSAVANGHAENRNPTGKRKIGTATGQKVLAVPQVHLNGDPVNGTPLEEIKSYTDAVEQPRREGLRRR